MLILVDVKKRVLSLTDLGSRFHETTQNMIHLFREQLSTLKPPKTVSDLESHNFFFSRSESVCRVEQSTGAMNQN